MAILLILLSMTFATLLSFVLLGVTIFTAFSTCYNVHVHVSARAYTLVNKNETIIKACCQDSSLNR